MPLGLKKVRFLSLKSILVVCAVAPALVKISGGELLGLDESWSSWTLHLLEEGMREIGRVLGIASLFAFVL